MAINIKELFVTDLNPNSGVWWSKDKIDKINYNFDQLSNGGMPGPQGTIGADGGDGNMGAQGDTGYKGLQGYQGPQGAESLNDWDYFPEGNGLPGYLFPRKNPATDIQSAPVALRIGFLGNDSEYNDGVNPIDTPIQVIKTKDSSWVNLRVEDNGGFNGYNFKFGSNSSNPNFEITPDLTDSNFKIIYVAQTIVLKTGSITNSLLNNSIVITDSQITINNGGIGGPFNLGSAAGTIVTSQDVFRFTPGAAEDRVLVSTNTNGDVEWKSVKDVFGTFPIGSIVSIRANEFITDHFWLNDSINVTAGSPLNNIYGRGKAGTDYEGWYLCNGETWETEQGFNQFLTPNLNNFSYTIGANGDAQNPITILEDAPILIGGYDMRISAVPSAAGIYTVGYTNEFLNNNTSPGISSITMGTSGLYETSRMIHIVYLENHDLKWSNTGVYVPPITTNAITLTEPIMKPGTIGALMSCSLPVDMYYSWTGNTDWNTFTIPSTYKLFNNGTTDYVSSGWYKNIDGYPIFWNGTDFTQRGATCSGGGTTNNLITSLLVEELNGPSNFVGDLYLQYNAPLFINATTLKWSDDQPEYPVGTNAPKGWYREGTSGVRRYWNGSIFVGFSFTRDYVCRVEIYQPSNGNLYDPGYNSAIQLTPTPLVPEPASVCDATQMIHITYVAANTELTPPPSGTTLAEHVMAYGSALYVTVGWDEGEYSLITGELTATPPLINIKDQNRPNTIGKYTKVYLNGPLFGESPVDYGKLNVGGASATGQIIDVLEC